MQLGDMYVNTINGSTAEVVEIRGDIITFACVENTSGFLHVVKEPVPETTLRRQEINYLNQRYIETGILKIAVKI